VADIRHRVGIVAPVEEVFEALSTREGLSGWWTRETSGNAGEGGTLSFYFGRPEPSAVMEVTEVTPLERVVWRCDKGPDEWVGTTLHFELETNDGETVLLFTHAGWRDPVEFMYHCSTKWGYLLLGLKASFEGGKAAPYPSDAKISSWG
jgi:uncharacterized protein YndB with AHSA1/START domain